MYGHGTHDYIHEICSVVLLIVVGARPAELNAKDKQITLQVEQLYANMHDNLRSTNHCQPRRRRVVVLDER